MSHTIPTDDVIRAQRGEAGALDQLIRTLTPVVNAMLRRFPMSDEDRMDAAQNALLRVCCALSSYRQEAQFTTWLYRVCANEALMLMRKARTRGAREVVTDLDRLVQPQDDDETEEGARLRDALAAMPAHYRAVLEGYYGEGRGLHEIAAQIGESESATRARLHRARQLLRQRLGLGAADHEAALRAA